MNQSLSDLVKGAFWRLDRAAFCGRIQRVVTKARAKRAGRRVLTSATHHDHVAFEPMYGLFHRLCDRLGSDKGSVPGHTQRPYAWAPHTYASVYDGLFGHCRDHVRLVFECGLGTRNVGIPNNMGENARPGASLRVWREFFPLANVYGADIDRESLFSEERINTVWVDQTDPCAIARMWEEIGVVGFDLIVDDGLHTFNAGKTLFKGSFDRLRPGGLYVIEDVGVHDLLMFQSWFREQQIMAEFHQLFYGRHTPSDNNLVIVRRY